MKLYAILLFVGMAVTAQASAAGLEATADGLKKIEQAKITAVIQAGQLAVDAAASAAAAAKAAVLKGAEAKAAGAIMAANATARAAQAAQAAAVDSAMGAAVSARNVVTAGAGLAAGAVTGLGGLVARRAQDVAGEAAAAVGAHVGAGLGAAAFGASAVHGNLYDLADDFMLRPMVEANASDFAPGATTGNGFCFPKFVTPDWSAPTLTCPTSYALSGGKCVRRTARASPMCFRGPVCMAPFNATGEPQCFDDKVQQVITGLMALKRASLGLPAQIAPALAQVANATAALPLALARESLELHVGAAAKAVGAGKALLLGADSKELVDYGSRLMVINWPALPDFQGLFDAVRTAIKKVPTAVFDEVKTVAPKCLRKCCKDDVRTDTAFALPSFACPPGKAMDVIGAACIPENKDLQLGFKPCPAGMRVCVLTAWKRPLCASEAKLFGIEACSLFETLLAAHKLPKVACP